MKSIKKNHKIVALAICASTLLSSCATLVSEGQYKVLLNGDTTEPVSIYTEAETIYKTELPIMVKVSRHHINGQRIFIKSENHKYKDIVLMRKNNGWAWGNILFGGIIGLSIDLATNSVSIPSQKEYKVEMIDDYASENSNDLNTIVSSDSIQ